MNDMYGDTAADQMIDNFGGLVTGALDGDSDTLRVLLAATAQTGFVAGYSAAASVMGVTL